MVCYSHLIKTKAHMFADITELKDGILPCQWLRIAAAEDIITGSYKIPESNYQPASLDLRLGEKAYRLRCSFLPDSQGVNEKLEDLTMGELDLRDGAILEKDRPYLIPLLSHGEGSAPNAMRPQLKARGPGGWRMASSVE